ncbi:hypothetical protein, partial [Pseudomonas gessardii]
SGAQHQASTGGFECGHGGSLTIEKESWLLFRVKARHPKFKISVADGYLSALDASPNGYLYAEAAVGKFSMTNSIENFLSVCVQTWPLWEGRPEHGR